MRRVRSSSEPKACIDWLSLLPIPIGDFALPKAVLYGTVAQCGPEQWPGTYELQGILADDAEFFTTMTIEGFARSRRSAADRTAPTSTTR